MRVILGTRIFVCSLTNHAVVVPFYSICKLVYGSLYCGEKQIVYLKT